MTIHTASPSLVSISDVVENADRAAKRLGAGLAIDIVNDAIQAPLATAIEAQSEAWKSLLSRLDTLMKVGDIVAEVCFILNYLPPVIVKYFQTGSPLDPVNMGSRLSSV